MTRQIISRHGDTHRPPGTLGPDDPGGSDPTSSIASVQVLPFAVNLIWGATSGFYSFPSNDDGVKMVAPAFLTKSAAGSYGPLFQAVGFVAATYEALSGGLLTLSVYNPNVDDYQAAANWISIQKIGSTSRQVSSVATPTTIPAGTTVNLPWSVVGPDTLIDITSPAAPVWAAGGEYAVSATVLISVP